MTGITAPPRGSGRIQARELFQRLAEDLTGSEIAVDFSQLHVVTPSFIDEMVLVILSERKADRLRLRNVDDRTQAFAVRSALAREVSDRLSVERRADGVPPRRSAAG